MLHEKDTALLVIDVQDKLFGQMRDQKELLHNLPRMIQGAQALGLPIVWAEQYPQGMGKTIPEISKLLADQEPIAKKTFSLCARAPLKEAIEATACKKFLLVGIETHVCVYQTSLDLLAMGKEVEVVIDCVSSRTKHNRKLGLRRIEQAGGRLTSLEMVLFELMHSAEHACFKDILALVK